MNASVQTEQISEEEEEKLIKASSLDSLKVLFPDLKKGNDDLLKVSFNVAVANLVNSNGHGVLGADAVACMENFVHKPFNVEHNSSMVIGHATNYGFSTFGDNKIIESVTGKYTKSLLPFNMALGGVVYKRADSYYADLIKDSSKKGNYWYGAISASWEILFDEYIIAIGSKRLADAELVKDDEKVKELTRYLADEEGGTGFMKDGTPVYRIVVGNILPAGVGFTFTPAANVKGLAVEDELDGNKKTKSYSNEDPSVASIWLEANPAETEDVVSELKTFVEEKFEEIKEQISQKGNLSVSKKRHMKITDISDINEETLKESLAATDIRNFIKEQLSAKDAEFKQAEEAKAKEIAAKESEIAAKEAELSAQIAKVTELEEKVSKVETSLTEVQAAKSAMEQSIAFNERMQIVDEKFEIGDEQREVIAKQIKSLDEDGFNSWLNDFGKILAAKSSGDVSKTLSSASSKEDVPNAQEQEEVSDLEKYKKSFAKVTISV